MKSLNSLHSRHRFYSSTKTFYSAWKSLLKPYKVLNVVQQFKSLNSVTASLALCFLSERFHQLRATNFLPPEAEIVKILKKILSFKVVRVRTVQTFSIEIFFVAPTSLADCRNLMWDQIKLLRDLIDLNPPSINTVVTAFD